MYLLSKSQVRNNTVSVYTVCAPCWLVLRFFLVPVQHYYAFIVVTVGLHSFTFVTRMFHAQVGKLFNREGPRNKITLHFAILVAMTMKSAVLRDVASLVS